MIKLTLFIGCLLLTLELIAHNRLASTGNINDVFAIAVIQVFLCVALIISWYCEWRYGEKE